jgi:hypothetical protein
MGLLRLLPRRRQTEIYGPPLRCRRNVRGHRLVCAALFSPFVVQSRETFSGFHSMSSDRADRNALGRADEDALVLSGLLVCSLHVLTAAPLFWSGLPERFNLVLISIEVVGSPPRNIEPSPAGRSEQALLNIRRDISFREQFLRARELRIQLTLRPWPIADPRR